MKILVTGGAGYIGSHAVLALGEAGHDMVVYDNISTGHDWAVLHGELVVADLSDLSMLRIVLAEHNFDAVIHFAGSIVVPESVENPLKYYTNNTCNTLGLLQCCVEAGVKYFMFSSTAAVYGMPDSDVVDELTPLQPINPYGASKMMSEQMIRDTCAASNMKYCILRYFNAAGADPSGRIGQSTPNTSHLIKLACETALGNRDSLTVFGTDYPTSDGTCVRDYIHVSDLASAHLYALAYLDKGGESDVFNCGYGSGYSVRQVIKAVENVSSANLKVLDGDRRAGDPAKMVADSCRLQNVTGWQPKHNDLEEIVGSALSWERKLPTILKAQI